MSEAESDEIEALERGALGLRNRAQRTDVVDGGEEVSNNVPTNVEDAVATATHSRPTADASDTQLMDVDEDDTDAVQPCVAKQPNEENSTAATGNY